MINKQKDKPTIWAMCRPCAEGAKDSYDIKVQLGKSEKITCAICGRRRYGSEHEVRRKSDYSGLPKSWKDSLYRRFTHRERDAK